MAKLRDKQDAGKDTTVRVAMKCGRIPIDSAYEEWVGPNRKTTHDGIVLHMSGIEEGRPLGYAELDLSDPGDKRVYDRLVAWLDEDKDPRIRKNGIKLLSKDHVEAPFMWWDATSAKILLSQVVSGIESQPDPVKREAFVAQCVAYERQRDNPRKTLIAQLLDLELDAVPSSDPMAVPSGR